MNLKMSLHQGAFLFISGKRKVNSKKMTLLGCLLLLAGIIASYLYYLATLSSDYADTCSASIIVFHKNVQANFTLDFMYNKDAKRGVISVSGSYM